MTANLRRKGKPRSGKAPEEAISLITRAMDKIDSDDEWYTLGQLGQYITRDNPDFDPRSYGEKKLSSLVMKLKRFETQQDGTHLQIRRRD